MTPKPAELRSVLPAAATEQSSAKALAIFLPSFCLYWFSFFGAVLVTSLVPKLLFCFATVFFAALLFVIGHDACHGSFTRHPWLNHLLGRLAFLPSLHPFTSWELGHNRLHHCWTNLRGKDYVWTPLSKSEFDHLPPRRRALERFYRSVFGIGFYYLIEVWFRHMVFPRPSDRSKLPRATSTFDRASVVAFAVAQVALAAVVGRHSTTTALLNIAFAVVVPQLLWHWLMGFVILLHHTHPKVRWYDDPAEWSFYAGQVQSTVHVEFPWPIGPLLHHIMEHTAHHIEPRIPLYNLPSAQRAVRDARPEDVIVSRFTPSTLFRTLSACQLYDYRRHCWLTFDGTPTTEPTTRDALLATHQ